MSILWSRIHAELGVAPRPLTYDMIETAVGRRVREAADLDWQLVVIPADDTAGQGKQKAIDVRRKEFAKTSRRWRTRRAVRSCTACMTSRRRPIISSLFR